MTCESPSGHHRAALSLDKDSGNVPYSLPRLVKERTKDSTCRVPGCHCDISNGKTYHQKYRICERHLQAQAVMINGEECRFCQQCGKFHDLSCFENTRRSCRDQLAKHNARLRFNRSQRPKRPRNSGNSDETTTSEQVTATGLQTGTAPGR